jgi:pyridoxine 4-dehydrogenase
MNSINASAAGRFKIGDRTINRLGYGAMRITGRGIWGPPPDRRAALATLRRLPEIGVNFIDTADSYGPDVSEELIREALHPYAGLLIATKAGLTRPGPDQWQPNGHPDYLISQAKGSLRKLGVKQIALWQLHRIDPKVPRDEQFGAVRQLLDEGIIQHAGLSEVSVADIEAARRVFPVATVQNRYNLVDRGSEDVLAYCAANNIGFIPWFPLAAGELIQPGGLVDRIARARGATTGQVALAWLLQRSPVILPIPGTLQVAHLEENAAAAGLALTPEEVAELDAAA